MISKFCIRYSINKLSHWKDYIHYDKASEQPPRNNDSSSPHSVAPKFGIGSKQNVKKN